MWRITPNTKEKNLPLLSQIFSSHDLRQWGAAVSELLLLPERGSSDRASGADAATLVFGLLQFSADEAPAVFQREIQGTPTPNRSWLKFCFAPQAITLWKLPDITPRRFQDFRFGAEFPKLPGPQKTAEFVNRDQI